MNERRSDNERRDNEKLFELLESTHLVVRDKRGRTHISQILDELVKRMSDIKNDNEGNDWLPEISIPFPVVTEEDELLPEYSFREITLSASVKGHLLVIPLLFKGKTIQNPGTFYALI